MAQIPASRLKSQPPCSNPSLQALIPASRLNSHSPGQNPSLEAQIPVSRLKFQVIGPFGAASPPTTTTTTTVNYRGAMGQKRTKRRIGGKRSLTHSPYVLHSALFPCTSFCSAALRSVHCAPLQSSPLRTVSEKVAMN